MKKSIKHTKNIKLPMYNCVVHLIITNQSQKTIKAIFKKYNFTEDPDDVVAEGMVITPDISDYYMVIDLNYLSYNTICHELYHCVVRITEDRDITDEETQAWLAGHLSGIVFLHLDKKNLKIKHGG